MVRLRAGCIRMIGSRAAMESDRGAPPWSKWRIPISTNMVSVSLAHGTRPCVVMAAFRNVMFTLCLIRVHELIRVLAPAMVDRHPLSLGFVQGILFTLWLS